MADEPIKAGEAKVRLDVDVSDALKGLKALQRVARETGEALKMAEAFSINVVNNARERYLLELFRICERDFKKDLVFSYREINESMFDAVTNDAPLVTIYKTRGEGFTTSAIAAAKAFDNVVLVVANETIAEKLRKDRGIVAVSRKKFPHNLRGRNIKTVIIDIEDDRGLLADARNLFDKVIVANCL
jgi:hypothetical protein